MRGARAVVLAVLLATMTETAESQAPRPSTLAGRSTVYTPHGVIATSQPLASAAGLAVLQSGGNAGSDPRKDGLAVGCADLVRRFVQLQEDAEHLRAVGLLEVLAERGIVHLPLGDEIDVLGLAVGDLPRGSGPVERPKSLEQLCGGQHRGARWRALGTGEEIEQAHGHLVS